MFWLWRKAWRWLSKSSWSSFVGSYKYNRDLIWFLKFFDNFFIGLYSVHMKNLRRVMGILDISFRSSLYLQLAVSLCVILAPLLYILYVFCLKRRDHPKNQRTGSIKAGVPQTSPIVSRKVSIVNHKNRAITARASQNTESKYIY